jgi:hypothetical protein
VLRVPSSFLRAVSCASRAFCIAVGGSPYGALIERWNGRAWSIEPAPSGVVGSPDPSAKAGLVAVSCATPSACTAVGTPGGSKGGDVLIERWSGQRWKRQRAAPDPVNEVGGLTAVSCSSVSACMALGSQQTATEQWTGRRWVIRDLAQPSGNWGTFDAVDLSCAAASDCLTIGTVGVNCTPSESGPGDCQEHALVERFDGRRWSVVPGLRLPGGGGLDNARVSCSIGGRCTIVGLTAGRARRLSIWAVRLTGRRWSAAVRGFVGGYGRVSTGSIGGWSCAASSCTATLSVKTANGTRKWVSERLGEHGWTSSHLATPNVGWAAPDVSCPDDVMCVAVAGMVNRDQQPVAFAERYAHRRWSTTRARNRTVPLPTQLTGVSCTARSFCMAVGPGITGQDWPLAARWNGTRWRFAPFRRPEVGVGRGPSAASCTYATDCMSVGLSRFTAGNNENALAAHWNGRRWKTARIAVVDLPSTNLEGVACPSRNSCIAAATLHPIRARTGVR